MDENSFYLMTSRLFGRYMRNTALAIVVLSVIVLPRLATGNTLRPLVFPFTISEDIDGLIEVSREFDFGSVSISLSFGIISSTWATHWSLGEGFSHSVDIMGALPLASSIALIEVNPSSVIASIARLFDPKIQHLPLQIAKWKTVSLRGKLNIRERMLKSDERGLLLGQLIFFEYIGCSFLTSYVLDNEWLFDVSMDLMVYLQLDQLAESPSTCKLSISASNRDMSLQATLLFASMIHVFASFTF